MSKYKTPIRIHLDTTKKINEKTTKYRLPFQKEQPSHTSLRKLESHSLIIPPQMHPHQINPTNSVLEKQSKKSEPQINMLEAETVLKKHEQREVINQLQTQSVIQVPVAIVEMPVAMVEKQQHYTQTIEKLQVLEVKQVQKQNQQTQVETVETQVKQEVIMKRVESKLSIDRSHELKLEPTPPPINFEPIQPKLPEPIIQPQIHIEPIQSKKFEPLQLKSNSFYRRSEESFAERKINYRSLSNRYADEQHYADASRSSDMDASTFLNTNPRAMPKIIRKPKQAKPTHNSVKKVQRQVWQILSQCTQKQQKLGLPIKHHKRSKSKLKHNKPRQSQSEMKQKSKLMLQKLKDIHGEKTEEEIINQDMYDDLPPINQDSQVSQISKEEHDSIIHKLHSLLELKQSAKKQKTGVPLQKYRKQYELIHKINPFFKKLNQFAGCILLSMGKIKFVDAGDLIFTEGEPISHLSIIILGKVLLTKAFNQYRNFGLPGESLGQEALFDQSKPYHLRLTNTPKSIFYRSQARAHSKVCILRISLRKFYKVSMELGSIGEKRLFNLIDNLFKINYLKKNALLNQQLKERLQTEILVTRRKKKGSLYFH